MLSPSYTNQFKKDFKLAKKRGQKIEKIKVIMSLLINEDPLPKQLKEHSLLGNFKDRRECHIEPDWLIIYKVSNLEIIFERTGSHSDLFKK